MRITLLAIVLIALSSAHLKTYRQNPKDVFRMGKINTPKGNGVNLDEPWPFSETLSRTDPSVIELTYHIENND